MTGNAAPLPRSSFVICYHTAPNSCLEKKRWLPKPVAGQEANRLDCSDLGTAATWPLVVRQLAVEAVLGAVSAAALSPASPAGHMATARPTCSLVLPTNKITGEEWEEKERKKRREALCLSEQSSCQRFCLILREPPVLSATARQENRQKARSVFCSLRSGWIPNN